MSCPKVEDIYAYLENELSAESRDELANHFLSCLRCQKILTDRQAYLQALTFLPDYEPTSKFTQDVMEQLPRLQSPSKVWLSLIGGTYLIFGLLMAILLSGIKNFLFDLSMHIFRSIFHSAVYLSQLVSQVFLMAFGLIKSAKITLGVLGLSLLNFWSGKAIVLITSVTAIVLTLWIFWLLLKSFQSANPGGNHEN